MAQFGTISEFEEIDRSYLQQQDISSRRWNQLVGSTVILTVGAILSAALYSYSATSQPIVLNNELETPSKMAFKAHHTKDVDIEDSDTALPNFVFVLADDMGWNSIGYEDYDLTFATPYMTGMAKNGIVMSNYYAQEVCTPSRAAFLTGRYPLSIGMQYGVVATDTAWGMNLYETTLAEVLKDNGYKTHMVGKWHLGHHSPQYLPTARGFDTFTGYLDGDNFYFSKKNPTLQHFHDFLSSDTSCFYAYDNADMHNYSTHFYRDLALGIIEEHDQTDPLFLYLAFQAVHDPFKDLYEHRTVSEDYLRPGIYKEIMTTVSGEKRQQYGMALAIMDAAVEQVVDKLDEVGMLNNTYIIFASDNGGCYLGGGKNGPLRGTKGTLFEGGTKVDSFVFSPLLPSRLSGTTYNNIMHVSDWFPTMLSLANIDYTASDGYELDGYSHETAWGYNSAVPRDYVLYNDYYNVEDFNFDLYEGRVFAIRNSRYKLIHAYNSSVYASWFDFKTVQDDDFNMGTNMECLVATANEGTYYYGFYDLQEDPYEQINLYDNDDYSAVKADLYNQLSYHENRSTTDVSTVMQANKDAMQIWKDAGNYIVPFVDTDNEQITVDKSYPRYCGSTSSILDDDGEVSAIDVTDPVPTVGPTFQPTHKHSSKTSK